MRRLFSGRILCFRMGVIRGSSAGGPVFTKRNFVLCFLVMVGLTIAQCIYFGVDRRTIVLQSTVSLHEAARNASPPNEPATVNQTNSKTLKMVIARNVLGKHFKKRIATAEREAVNQSQMASCVDPPLYLGKPVLLLSSKLSFESQRPRPNHPKHARFAVCFGARAGTGAQ